MVVVTIVESFRLFHEGLFLHGPVKKGSFDVHLAAFQPHRFGDGKDKTNSLIARDSGIRVKEVHTRDLLVSSQSKASFVPRDPSIGMPLQFEKPAAG